MSVITTNMRRNARKPVQAKPVKRQLEKPIPQGLCQTCNHARGCAYVRNPSQPVLFCEEFDNFTPPMVEVDAEAPAPTAEDMNNWDEYKGLCVNCDMRETCAIRKPETGIWHCEEYK